MKNSLFQKNLLDNDILLSAVNKAREKVGVLNSGAEQTILGETSNKITRSTIISQSKIDQVEDRLGYLDRTFFPYTPKPYRGVVSNGSNNPVPFDPEANGDAGENDKGGEQSEALLRGVETKEEYYDYLKKANIDILNATPQQKILIDKVGNKLFERSILGTLTEDEKNKMFEDAWNSLYSIMPRAQDKYYKLPEIGTASSTKLEASEFKYVVESGDTQYKDKLYRKTIQEYVAARREGAVEVGDYKQFYDRAVVKYYENYAKPIYVRKDADGKKLEESILIGKLIPPEDDSFGAQVARAAMRLVGLKYKAPAGQGYYSEMLIDCSALVKWAVTEVNQYLGEHGVTKKAKYQYAATKKPIWTINQGEFSMDTLKPGDTLFWKGDETGEIKHTAIYIGNGLMVEAQNESVQVVGVREETHDSDGEDSTLVQVNRMTEDDLLIKAKRNEQAWLNREKHS